jgi:hypothetical protein
MLGLDARSASCRHLGVSRPHSIVRRWKVILCKTGAPLAEKNPWRPLPGRDLEEPPRYSTFNGRRWSAVRSGAVGCDLPAPEGLVGEKGVCLDRFRAVSEKWLADSRPCTAFESTLDQKKRADCAFVLWLNQGGVTGGVLAGMRLD